MRHDDINTVIYYPLGYVPLRVNYDQGVETNIAKLMMALSDKIFTGRLKDKMAWILSEIPDTRIDIELTPEQDTIQISAVFADHVDATAFKLRWV